MESKEDLLDQYATMLEGHSSSIRLGLMAGAVIGRALEGSDDHQQLAAGVRALSQLNLRESERIEEHANILKGLLTQLFEANGSDLPEQALIEGEALTRDNFQEWREYLLSGIEACRASLKPWKAEAEANKAWDSWFDHFLATLSHAHNSFEAALKPLKPVPAHFVVQVRGMGPAATDLKPDVGSMTIANWSRALRAASSRNEQEDLPHWLAVVAAAYLGLADRIELLLAAIDGRKKRQTSQELQMIELCRPLVWARQRLKTAVVFAPDDESATATWKPSADYSAFWFPLDAVAGEEIAERIVEAIRPGFVIVDGSRENLRHSLIDHAAFLGGQVHWLRSPSAETADASRPQQLPSTLRDALSPLILKTQ
jgi:hypothetical protein